MAEVADQFEDNVRHLPIVRARFQVDPSKNLEEALRQYIKPDSKLGQGALFLNSRSVLMEYTKGEALRVNSHIERRLHDTLSHQHKLTRSIRAMRDKKTVSLNFTALLTHGVQQRMHEFQSMGLSQLVFGRKALEIGLRVPAEDVVDSKRERHMAARAIREVVWGGTPIEEADAPLAPPDSGGAYVTNLQWVVRF